MGTCRGQGQLDLGGCLGPRSVPGAVGVLAVAVARPYPDVVLSVILEADQGMRGRVRVGVASFRRVGGIVLGALGPVEVVVRGVGVWCSWGCPGEQELASGVVSGRDGVDGSCWRSCIFRRRVIPGRVIPGRLFDRVILDRVILDRVILDRPGHPRPGHPRPGHPRPGHPRPAQGWVFPRVLRSL